jgi:hypothetical protein
MNSTVPVGRRSSASPRNPRRLPAQQRGVQDHFMTEMFPPGVFRLVFRGQLLQPGEGEDRTILADVLIPDVAAAANADPAFHAHFQGKDDPFRGESQF